MWNHSASGRRRGPRDSHVTQLPISSALFFRLLSSIEIACLLVLNVLNAAIICQVLHFTNADFTPRPPLSYFTDGKSEAEWELTWPGTHSQEVAKPRFQKGPSPVRLSLNPVFSLLRQSLGGRAMYSLWGERQINSLQDDSALFIIEAIAPDTHCHYVQRRLHGRGGI